VWILDTYNWHLHILLYAHDSILYFYLITVHEQHPNVELWSPSIPAVEEALRLLLRPLKDQDEGFEESLEELLEESLEEASERERPMEPYEDTMHLWETFIHIKPQMTLKSLRLFRSVLLSGTARWRVLIENGLGY
jgi:hypothetical protein